MVANNDTILSYFSFLDDKNVDFGEMKDNVGKSRNDKKALPGDKTAWQPAVSF